MEAQAIVYSGFWRRFLAACIDLALFSPLYEVALRLFGPRHTGLADSAFGVVALILYAACFASSFQATPGMWLLHSRITDRHYQRIGFTRALWWGVSSSLAWIICFGGVLYLQAHTDLTAVRDLSLSCIEENVTEEDCHDQIEQLVGLPYANFQKLLMTATVLTLFLLVIWALSIALPRDKTGFHNLLCGTRFVNGRARPLRRDISLPALSQ